MQHLFKPRICPSIAIPTPPFTKRERFTVRLAVPAAKPKSEIVAKHLKYVWEPQIS